MFEHWWRSGHQSLVNVSGVRDNLCWKFKARELGADAIVVFSCPTWATSAGTRLKNLSSSVEPTCGAARAELLTTISGEIAKLGMLAIRATLVEAVGPNTERLDKEAHLPSKIIPDNKENRNHLKGLWSPLDRIITMAPSTMSATSPVIRKRKGRADSPSSLMDTTSALAPVKAIPAANGTNGNGVSKTGKVSKDTVPSKTVLNVKPTTGIRIHTEIRQFNCVKHVKPADFPKTLSTLPFPESLNGLVAWTDAFVERLGLMAMAEKQQTTFQQTAIDLLTKEKADLQAKIDKLKAENDDLIDAKYHLQSENSQLSARNKSLEKQHEDDVKQISDFEKTSHEQVAQICALIHDNEGLKKKNKNLKAEVKRLVNHNIKDDLLRESMMEAFEAWIIEDDREDQERERINQDLTKQLEEQRIATNNALVDLETAKQKLHELEAHNAGLVTKCAQYEELIKTLRDQLQASEEKYRVAEAGRVTLEGTNQGLQQKLQSCLKENENLHLQLHTAELDIVAAKDKVRQAEAHAKQHWNVLESIRVDGRWARTDEGDDCELLMAPKVIYCGASEQPAEPTPAQATFAVAEPVAVAQPVA
ncbi:hypothetical protein N7454_001676 [Penicillium verhagenii]|nr:hypothetical protein N7454_001676 [Penicillium verhagenii]